MGHAVGDCVVSIIKRGKNSSHNRNNVRMVIVVCSASFHRIGGSISLYLFHQYQNERGLLVVHFGEITSGQRRQNTLNFLLAHPRHFYSSKTVVVKYEMTLLVIF